MSQSLAAKSSKEKTTEEGHSRVEGRAQHPVSTGVHADILNLQRSVGNRAVSQVLKSRTENYPEGMSDIPPIVHEVLRSSGQPLDSDTQADMGSRFGYDFSQVRVHTDHSNGKVSKSAHALKAEAYTIGHDVVFGAGHFDPISPNGKALLAHELAHVVQQSTVPSTPLESLSMASVSDSAEFEAEKVAEGVLHGEASTTALHTYAPAIARSPDKQQEIPAEVGVKLDLIDRRILDEIQGLAATSIAAAEDRINEIDDLNLLRGMRFLNQQDLLGIRQGEKGGPSGNNDNKEDQLFTIEIMLDRRIGEREAHVEEAKEKERARSIYEAEFGSTEQKALVLFGAPEDVLDQAIDLRKRLESETNPVMREALSHRIEQLRQRFDQGIALGRASRRRRKEARELEEAEKELREAEEELAKELAKVAIDVAGIADPTPISDAIGTAISLSEGDLVGAGLSLVSIVPYAGDALGKTAKGARALNKIAKIRRKLSTLRTKVSSLIKRSKRRVEKISPQRPSRPRRQTEKPDKSTRSSVSAKGETKLDEELDEAFEQLKAGQIPEQGELIELLGHKTAPKARKARGQSGRQFESAHGGPQAALRNLPHYDPNAALTRILPKAVHRSMDAHWQRVARRLKRRGHNSWTAEEMFRAVSNSIKKTKGLTPAEKISHVQRLKDEIFVELGLKSTDLLRLPFT